MDAEGEEGVRQTGPCFNADSLRLPSGGESGAAAGSGYRGAGRLAGLIEDPRFLGPASQLLGDDLIGVNCTANRFVGDTEWHCDGGGQPVGQEEMRWCKCVFHLVDSIRSVGIDMT